MAVYPPFCQCVEWFIRSLGDDRHLVASNVVDQTTALDDGLRTDQSKVHSVHHIRYGGIEHHGARDPGGGERLVRFQAEQRLVNAWIR